MKRRLGLLLVAMLVLSLVACGKGAGEASSQAQGKTDAPLEREENTKKSEVAESKPSAEEKSGEATGTQSGDINSFSDIQSATDVIWGKQDTISRQEIIDMAKAEGIEVSFGADGSMTMVDQDGSVLIQNPDGSWTVQEEDGSTSQLGGSWPSNEFTALIPDPGFAILGLSASEDEFTAAFQNASVDDIKAYAEKIKAKGFTVDPEEQDREVAGVTIYTYEAYNDDGYYAKVFYTSGTSGVTVSK
ncbi:MAG: hypothetical protein J5546_09240 [Lachnospiraceae bacterium]|nr:hypothetical protein [Lachnospiraceae bacterium]